MHLEKPLQIRNTPPKAAGPDIAIYLAHRFAAPPQSVFRAWLDPEIAGRWLFATATRPMTAVITPRPNSRFRFTDGLTTHSGRYLHIAEPRQLAFTLDDTHSRVSVEFAPRGAGCLLKLQHHGLPREQARFAKARWQGMFYGLSEWLASNQG